MKSILFGLSLFSLTAVLYGEYAKPREEYTTFAEKYEATFKETPPETIWASLRDKDCGCCDYCGRCGGCGKQ